MGLDAGRAHHRRVCHSDGTGRAQRTHFSVSRAVCDSLSLGRACTGRPHPGCAPASKLVSLHVAARFRHDRGDRSHQRAAVETCDDSRGTGFVQRSGDGIREFHWCNWGAQYSDHSRWCHHQRRLRCRGRSHAESCQYDSGHGNPGARGRDRIGRGRYCRWRYRRRRHRCRRFRWRRGWRWSWISYPNFWRCREHERQGKRVGSRRTREYRAECLQSWCRTPRCR